MKHIAYLLLFTCALTLFSAPLDARAESDDIPYFCGIAVGEAEQADDAKSPYTWTLKCIFADKQTRAYLSGIEVTVLNEQGGEMIQTLCDGAWIVMALPEGTYKVSCDYEGTPQERSIRVGRDMKTEYFFW